MLQLDIHKPRRVYSLKYVKRSPLSQFIVCCSECVVTRARLSSCLRFHFAQKSREISYRSSANHFPPVGPGPNLSLPYLLVPLRSAMISHEFCLSKNFESFLRFLCFHSPKVYFFLFSSSPCTKWAFCSHLVHVICSQNKHFSSSMLCFSRSQTHAEWDHKLA